MYHTLCAIVINICVEFLLLTVQGDFHLSKTMSFVLRHGAERLQLAIQPGEMVCYTTSSIFCLDFQFPFSYFSQ